MKILLAASDRDLLQGYEKLLTMDGHQVTTAFDGAQVVELMAGGPYDIAVLEEQLPRIGGEQLLELLRREALPAILLLDERVSVKHLLRASPPEAYLSFPFLPADLTELLDSTARKLAAKEIERFGGVVQPSGIGVSADACSTNEYCPCSGVCPSLTVTMPSSTATADARTFRIRASCSGASRSGM